MRKPLDCQKRPCRICRKWFMPNPKLKDRQKTCGKPACKKEWHRRKCAEWNDNNSDYFKANYLQRKLNDLPRCDKPSQSPCTPPVFPQSRLKSGLPLEYVQEVIGTKHLVIIEYLSQLLYGRFQEVLRSQVAVIAMEMVQLPP